MVNLHPVLACRHNSVNILVNLQDIVGVLHRRFLADRNNGRVYE